MKSKLRDKIKDPKILEMLNEPVGAPIDLTREQAIAIVDAGIGGRPDLPSGSEYVKRIRKIWRGLASDKNRGS